MSLRIPFVAFAVALVLTSVAHAEFPYPTCGGSLAPSCTDPADFESYLFLPTTTPPTIPSDLSRHQLPLLEPRRSGGAGDRAGALRRARAERRQGVAGDDRPAGRRDGDSRLGDHVGRRGAMTDLADKVHLNAAELPLPEATTTGYDRNADGVFNVRDYLADGTHAQDSRVSRSERQRSDRSARSDRRLLRRHRRRRQRLHRRHRGLGLLRGRQRSVRRRLLRPRHRRGGGLERRGGQRRRRRHGARTACSSRSRSPTASSPTSTTSRAAWSSGSTAARR